ncbi:hypothetical protein ACWIGM_09425 [Bosea sp. NPDC055332]
MVSHFANPLLAGVILLLAGQPAGAGNGAIAFNGSKTGKAMTAGTLAAEPAATTANAFMPTGYAEIARRPVAVDGERAELVRYRRSDGRNAALGGEHFSTVIAADGRLKGFARMDLDLVGGELPSRKETQAIAMDFLRVAAPDLLPVHEISWIEPHDEPLRVTRSRKTEQLTLTGMKVKMRNTADGRWMWVIVGADRKVMVFERDIVWVTFPGHRKTEKWLHDAWLTENGVTLP